MYFNPRPREEGDLSIIAIDDGIVISIHALVKRATTAILGYSQGRIYFNPRPREEGDCCKNIATQQAMGFQSTPS